MTDEVRDDWNASLESTRVVQGHEGSTTDSRSPTGVFTLEVGAAVDRFRVLEPIGRGGMGQVFRVHDPKLGREVALKLLHHSRDVESKERLRREAMAMARLSHPNVVPIYDIGELPAGGGLFLTMELVRGQTLGRWLRDQPRAWSQIIECFVAAGRGLLAAHEAGLIHRDFKPSNVMVDQEDRARVMDFGLARTAKGVAWSAEMVNGSNEPLDQMLTQADTVIGTPRYMAPEQHTGGVIDTRCDQYAFCVALWEALHGTPPFDAEDVEALIAAKLGETPDAPRASAVPRRVSEVLVRGLSVEPVDRFTSMVELLGALEQLNHRFTGRWPLILGVGLSVGIAVVGLQLGGETPQAMCTGAQARLVGVWDDAVRGRVESAVRATGLAHAEQTWSRLEQRLDEYAERWVTGHADACEATHLRHEQSEQVMDSRMRCLDGHLAHLRGLVGTLREADGEVVGQAVQATVELPDPGRCADLKYVEGQVAPPDDAEEFAQVEALRGRLAKAKAMADAGRYQQALEVVAEVRADAEELEYRPLAIEAALRMGKILAHLGRPERAIEPLEQAYFESPKWGLDEITAESAVSLVYVLGYRLGRHEEATPWVGHARAEVERLGDERLRASLGNNIGTLRYSEGRYSEALEAHQQAFSIREGIDPDDHRLGTSLNNMGTVYERLGRPDDAIASYRRAVELQTRALGPQHPVLATPLRNAGVLEWSRQRYEESLGFHRRALAVLEAAHGPEHLQVAASLRLIGYVEAERKDHEAARQAYTRALEIFEKIMPPTDPTIHACLNAIGVAYYFERHYDRALETHRRALSLSDRMEGGEPHRLASVQNIAEVLTALERQGEALAYYRQSVELLGRDEIFESPMLGSLALDAEVFIERGEASEVLDLLERRLPMVDAPDVTPEVRGSIHFALARALMSTEGDGARARRLAEKAKEELSAMTPPDGEALARVDRWLREHAA